MDCHNDLNSNVYDQIKVGSDGFIRLVDKMGDEAAIVQAARVSYGAGTKSVSDDRNLIRYLLRHKHTTPFEMVELKFHVRVPMDCWRQWIRHRTASVNEYSTRYSEAIDSAAATDENKWRLQSKSNKQGSSGYVTDWPSGIDNLPLMKNEYGTPGNYLSVVENDFLEHAREVYNERLTYGVSREQARKDLPLSTYTEAYWKIDLHNLLHFLGLRMDSHAQIEIREYANAIYSIVKQLYPNVSEAFENYRLNAITFSQLEQEYLVQAIRWATNISPEYRTLENCWQILRLKQEWALVDKVPREIQEFYDKIIKIVEKQGG